jgi:hypothetical protein
VTSQTIQLDSDVLLHAAVRLDQVRQELEQTGYRHADDQALRSPLVISALADFCESWTQEAHRTTAELAQASGDLKHDVETFLALDAKLRAGIEDTAGTTRSRNKPTGASVPTSGVPSNRPGAPTGRLPQQPGAKNDYEARGIALDAKGRPYPVTIPTDADGKSWRAQGCMAYALLRRRELGRPNPFQYGSTSGEPRLGSIATFGDHSFDSKDERTHTMVVEGITRNAQGQITCITVSEANIPGGSGVRYRDIPVDPNEGGKVYDPNVYRNYRPQLTFLD